MALLHGRAHDARLTKREALIAVGALHGIPGERGVLNLLDQRGYAIARVY